MTASFDQAINDMGKRKAENMRLFVFRNVYQNNIFSAKMTFFYDDYN